MPLDAGRLNKWVTLERPRDDGDARDAMGEPISPWIAIADFWASIEPQAAVEVFQGQQVRSNVTHLVTIRWRDDVKSSMRFVWLDARANKTRYFEIDGQPIDPEERGEELQIACQEQEA